MKKSVPQVHASETIHRGFFQVRQDLLHTQEGISHSYTLILTMDSTAILAQDIEGRWILNREYRHPTGKFLLGCPGGRLEPEEDPIAGGQREFYEETGYWSDEIILIGCCYPFPGLCNQKVYYLWAKNAFQKGTQKLDPLEIITPELKTDAELKEELRKENQVDATLCAALWYHHLYTK